jgi:hypothetical protein
LDSRYLLANIDMNTQKEVKLLMIYGNVSLDRFMHNFDVFESFKRLVVTNSATNFIETVILTVNEKFDPAKTIDVLREELAKTGNFAVMIHMPEYPDVTYIDSSIKVISNGNQWALMKDICAIHDIPFLEHI